MKRIRGPRVGAAVAVVILAAAGAPAQKGKPLERAFQAQAELYAPAPGYSEGPTWRSGSVFFCSGPLLRITSGRQVRKYLDIGPAGTYLLRDGRMLVCDNKNHALLLLWPNGRVGVLADRFEGKPLRILNDLTVDRAGNVYWTDPNSGDPRTPDGNVFRLTPSGRVDRIATGRAYPNGIEVDPEGRYLYLIESSSKNVLRYEAPPSDRPLGEATVFYTLKTGGDGCAFDADGNFWVTDYSGGEIAVLSPEGRYLGGVKIPAKAISNLTFGGKKRDTLFVTTGAPDGVFRVPVGVRGFRLHPGAKKYPVSRYLDLKPLDEPLPEGKPAP
jgi:sugar lactone lactonase YvrE